MICAGRPMFSKDEIERILVVKLDHIGDLITALPALRRLRRHFPKCADSPSGQSAAAKSFLAGEDCASMNISSSRFSMRAPTKGERGLTQDDLAALERSGLRLIASIWLIDLRKQIETRHVLQSIPTRFRRGI